ncbi:hypothetical protein MKZ38_001252 [Zalerion maritima]|uniref:Exosome complex component RRP45 n=1 Tax=Zalerion maritima TaxID=339359 RepID=A0AAD5WLT2_9PEZI|nr:hypothetical protein MKZ38_001252 [Zalerion maritima]
MEKGTVELQVWHQKFLRYLACEGSPPAPGRISSRDPLHDKSSSHSPSSGASQSWFAIGIALIFSSFLKSPDKLNSETQIPLPAVNMPREAEISTNEKQFLKTALTENVRIDGRLFEQYRPLSLGFGEEFGVAEVELGKTRILAKVSAEVTVPYADRPFDGIFQIVTELSPMVSPAFEVNRPTETEVLLSRLLEKTVRRSGALDTESLCLMAGKKCWAVRVDVHVLSHDGNLVDAACVAVVAALRHFRKPDTSVEGEMVTVYTAAEREPTPLSWLHSPYCVTWSFYGEEGEMALLDASWKEEQVQVASFTVSLNRHGEVCQIAKLGGVAVDAVLLLKCTAGATVEVKRISEMVDQKLEEDAKRRDKGGLMAELRAENERES